MATEGDYFHVGTNWISLNTSHSLGDYNKNKYQSYPMSAGYIQPIEAVWLGALSWY